MCTKSGTYHNQSVHEQSQVCTIYNQSVCVQSQIPTNLYVYCCYYYFQTRSVYLWNEALKRKVIPKLNIFKKFRVEVEIYPKIKNKF